MTQQNITMFFMANQKNFNQAHIPSIQNELKQIDDEQLALISSADYKSPTTVLILGFLLGYLGVDRFMVGDIGMGVLKLLTFGCLGILTIIDWFTLPDKARQKNYETFLNAVSLSKQVSINPNNSSNKETDAIQKIKEYKALLDAGIISEEEFEEKKRALL